MGHFPEVAADSLEEELVVADLGLAAGTTAVVAGTAVLEEATATEEAAGEVVDNRQQVLVPIAVLEEAIEE